MRSAYLTLAFLTAAACVGVTPARAADDIDARVEALLRRMTLDEKIGQMNMPCLYVRGLGKDVPSKQDGVRRFTAGKLVPGIGPAGGFFTVANQILHKGPRQQAEFFNAIQKIAIEKTRLGIPLLQTEEGTHGVMASGHTIFPEGPGIGSMWDMDLVHQIYTATAAEGRAVGIHQLFTIVIEPNRDPRLGRNEEGYSEDPYLCARIAETAVRAIQGDDIAAPDKAVAGLCHYPGQSMPIGGLERGAMEISERTLHEILLPPWVAGIKRAGALGVMATYPAINGVPVHASPKILTDLLRGELGFRGLVLSEGGGIGHMIAQRVAADHKEAGQLAIKAGVDVGISFEDAYMKDLAASVREGAVPMALIDRSVRRILKLKMMLGLFEKPYVDPERAAEIVHRPEHQELALRTARESIVLLKNEKGMLPLKKSLRRIAVIGPNADEGRNQLGDYHSKELLQEIRTVLNGIRTKLPGATVRYEKGCEITGEDRSGFAEAVAAARESEVAVVVLGEREWYAPECTNGENCDVGSIELTGVQEELLRAVHATGTPTVLVVINGRPLALRWADANVAAIVEAWLPGEKGGDAVADVLFGDWNPSGRLPVTVPRHAGQLPFTYDFSSTRGDWKDGRLEMRKYADMSGAPLYPFGHGLSYTSFEYRNLQVSPRRLAASGAIDITLEVRNTGSREGAETVQLYVRDPVASVTRPVQQLKGFEKARLKSGESRTVKFRLEAADLAFLDASLKPIVEPGKFEVLVGASAEDIRLRGEFEITP